MSSNHSKSYLDEMGIDTWILSHPNRLANYQLQTVKPEESVQLLFVCPTLPSNDEDIKLLENIAGTFQVQLDKIRHVYPQDFRHVQRDALNWVWFCGCQPPDAEVSGNLLQSPLLAEMHHNTQMKRQLWLQIKSYS